MGAVCVDVETVVVGVRTTGARTRVDDDSAVEEGSRDC